MVERLIWLVPLAVLVLGLWRPRAGLLALAAALPLFGSPPGGPYLAALDVAGIAAIGTAWRAGPSKPSPLTWPVMAFAAASLVTLVPPVFVPPSWHPAVLSDLVRVFPGIESWPALYTWRAAADLVLGIGLFFAVRRAFDGRSIRPLALALLVGLVATLVLGLGAHTGLLDLGDYRPKYSDRLQSLFFLSGWLSKYLVLAAPVALAGLAAGGRWARRLIVPVMVLAAVDLALTQQRGAWLSVAAQLAFCGALLAPHWRRVPLRRVALAATATVVLTGAILVGGGWAETLLDRARSVRSGPLPRLALWATAGEMVRQRPLGGWGLGTFALAYDLQVPRGTPGANAHRGTAHNLYLHVAAERGLLGLAAFGLLAWATARCLRRPRPGAEILVVGIAASLLGLAVYGLFQYMLYLRNLQWLAWILLGAVAVSTRADDSRRLSRAGQALVLAAVLLLPLRALFAAPPVQSRSFGFHETEAGAAGEFRWTESRAAERLRWSGETLVLGFANGHPRAGARPPVEVVVGVDGEELGRLRVAGGWEEHRFELGPPRREWVVLTLEVRPIFRPFSDYRRYPNLQGPNDIRALGVALRGPEWETGPATAAPAAVE